MRKLTEDKSPEINKERLIHADSGEGAQLDQSPDRDKINKEAIKELKDRVDYVEDDINNAEAPKPEATDGTGKKASIDGLTKAPKKIKEKLILEEPSDVISESLSLDEDLGTLTMDDMICLFESNVVELLNNGVRDSDIRSAFDTALNRASDRFGSNFLDWDVPGVVADIQPMGNQPIEISQEDALNMIQSGQGNNIKMLVGGKLVNLSDRSAPRLIAVAEKLYSTTPDVMPIKRSSLEVPRYIN